MSETNSPGSKKLSLTEIILIAVGAFVLISLIFILARAFGWRRSEKSKIFKKPLKKTKIGKSESSGAGGFA